MSFFINSVTWILFQQQYLLAYLSVQSQAINITNADLLTMRQEKAAVKFKPIYVTIFIRNNIHLQLSVIFMFLKQNSQYETSRGNSKMWSSVKRSYFPGSYQTGTDIWSTIYTNDLGNSEAIFRPTMVNWINYLILREHALISPWWFDASNIDINEISIIIKDRYLTHSRSHASDTKLLLELKASQQGTNIAVCRFFTQV